MVKKTSAKGSGKSTAIVSFEKEDYTTGATYKVGVTNEQYADVGNLSPAKVRAINIKASNMKLQREWGKEYLNAVNEIEDGRVEIEKIRADIEKKHFKSEAEIDEYILGALLAKTEYDAHYREWTARKAKVTKYVNGGADEEIRIVTQEFADRIRLRKTKADLKIKASKDKTDAEIAELGKDKDHTNAIAAAQKKASLKAFMRGDPMEVVSAIGGAADGAITVSARSSGDLPLLDAITSGNFFNFGK